MDETGNQAQMDSLVEKCRALGVDLHYDPKKGHFTALAWEDSTDERQALLIQQKIKRMTGQYPDLVCYCFDPFSTLVYMI